MILDWPSFLLGIVVGAPIVCMVLLAIVRIAAPAVLRRIIRGSELM